MNRNRKLVLIALVLLFTLFTTQIAGAVTYHTVQDGEWLSKIAPKYGLSWQALYELNRDTVKNPDLIFPGQQLVVSTATPTPEPVLGTVTADFQPADEIPGIAEARLRDTALLDLINKLQKDVTGADVSGAALPSDAAALKAGPVTASDLALLATDPASVSVGTVTGKELKAVMERAVSAYNTWKPGDVTVSFNPAFPLTGLDAFAGVTYKVDISQPAGKRITSLAFGGKAVTDDQKLRLALPSDQYAALRQAAVLPAALSLTSAAFTLTGVAEDLQGQMLTLAPVVDDNWSLVGANLVNPLRDEIIALVKAGTLSLPKSADGKAANAKSLNVYELIANGTLAGYKTIDLFHVNDTHGRIKAGDGMGFARIDTLVSAYRAANPGTMLLDVGDTLHGVNFVTLTRGDTAVKVMNAMKFDAMAPGNHDFNYGQARLTELDTLADFPILAANVKKADGTTLLTPYVIKTINGVKVALFGLATPETLYKTNPNNVAGLTFEDPAVTAKAMVAELTGKADVIVALAHLGIEGDYTSRKLAQAVPGIDVILDGHSHSVLNETVNGVLIAQTGYYDKGLGITTLVLKDGRLDQTGSTLYTMADAANTTESTAVKAIVTAADAQIETLTAAVIGTSPVELDGVRGNVRTKPTNLANLITAAMLDKTGADVAITNGGGIRASIKAGPVTKGDVLTVLPFGNYVVVKELKGSDILAALELGFSIYPEALGGYAQTAGMTIRFDSSKAKGSRIVDVKIGGVALDPAKTYKVATNDFMAVGGDNYTMLKNGPTVGEYPALDEILIEYIQSKGFGAAVVDDRVTDVAPAATSTVDLAPAA